ncbi:hypothetical protein MSAN_01386500 [Mycena sanguinolenta]|uniref:Hydrophobin n=1 Tax=Mycena sanguinolenta TaxID=230812 RepID=A0A8H6YAW2_9AGAR|nr:hypothetical protein MSAN_01386500 [Mycena sanguinolenta]
MKTTVAFCALSYAISAVGATRPESNAQRLARGLPPLAPKRRFSNLRSGAKRTAPSSTPFSCSPQKNFCCTTFESASSPAAESLLSSLGISQNSCGEQIATGCVAASGDSCDPVDFELDSRLLFVACKQLGVVVVCPCWIFVGCGFEQFFARKQFLVRLDFDPELLVRCAFE